MSWSSRVASNILPLSIEKQDILKAISEWQYRGDMYDIGSTNEVCQLCSHPEIRYQFEIVNKFNKNGLLVGSECIKKFPGITVFDEGGNALGRKDAVKKVNQDRRKLIVDANAKSLLNSLVALARADDRFDIHNFEEYYQEHGAFTPKQMAVLLWRFDDLSVPFNISCFKVRSRRAVDKEKLLELKDFQLKKMLGCLTNSQKEFLRENGRL